MFNGEPLDPHSAMMRGVFDQGYDSDEQVETGISLNDSFLPDSDLPALSLLLVQLLQRCKTMVNVGLIGIRIDGRNQCRNGDRVILCAPPSRGTHLIHEAFREFH